MPYENQCMLQLQNDCWKEKQTNHRLPVPVSSRMADVTALVLVPLDRWRVVKPIYVIGMIDRWAWLAHGLQMSTHLLSSNW